MNKFWKQTMALFLAFALVFGTLVPVVAWAEEPANIEEPNAVSKPEAPAEEETQTEKKEQLPEKELEGEEEVSQEVKPEKEEELDLGEEHKQDPVGAGPSLEPEKLVIIAKDKDGKFYGIPTYNEKFDDLYGTKKFFRISEEDYNKAQADFVLGFKRKDGKEFEIPKASIKEESGEAGTIFKEIRFRHFSAFQTLVQYTYMTDPKFASGVDGATWVITLFKDCVIEQVAGYAGKENQPDRFLVQYNCEIDGQKNKFSRNDAKEYGPMIDVQAPISLKFKNITIDGSQNGKPKYRGIDISDWLDPGVEIVFEGGVIVQKCRVGETNVDGLGGSVIGLLDGSTLTMTGEGNVVQDCVSEDDFYGTIYSDDSVTINIDGAKFINNQAPFGGVITSQDPNSKINISNATFANNTGTVVGGAIYSEGKTTIKDSTFTSNKAGRHGGAIYTRGTTTINNSTFASNNAEVHGGAIYVDGLVTDDNDRVTDVNTALKVKIEGNTKFESNTAGQEGGAIYTIPYQYQDTIDKNHTGEPVEEQKPYENLDIDNTTLFKGNQADGGLFVPPTNHQKFTNLKFDPKSDVKHEKLKVESLLNNYDVNYKGKEPTEPAEPSEPSTPSRDERIIVDPNGGTFSDGTTGQKTYFREIGETFVLPAAPTREGYKFVAWEGKSGTYQPGYPYIVKTGGEVFTARWEEEKKPEEKPSVKPNIKMPKGTPLTPDEIAKILQGMKKTVPAIPRAGVGK